MPPGRIERWNTQLDGPLSEAALQRKIEGLGYRISARTYPAGIAAPAPADPHPTLTAVVHGLVKLTLDDEPELLSAGDIALIPSGSRRRVEVVGPSTALCLEGFQPEPS